MRGLNKKFKKDGGDEDKIAVKSLSFGIKKGGVFGLLGVNGAGKTTTFKLLCG